MHMKNSKKNEKENSFYISKHAQYRFKNGQIMNGQIMNGQIMNGQIIIF